MLRRKSSTPFFIYSLILHCVIAFVLIRMWVDQRQLPFYPNLSVDIIKIARPQVTTPMREKVVPEPPPKPAEPVAKKPSPPKPMIANNNWMSIDSDAGNTRTAILDSSPPQKRSVSVKPSISATERPKIRATGISTVALPSVRSKEVIPPPGADQAVEVTDGDKDLTANSPELGSTELKFWHRRGGAFNGAPVGNTSGGGSTYSASGTTSSGQSSYVLMMNELARNVAEAAVAPEVDLVFIIDKTASMEDNIRGIRAYVHLFFEHMERTGHNTAVGLVTFADATKEKPKARGLTTDHNKFRNWLHKIEVEGGADLAEAGLDALMIALTRIKYRQGAQRFFVLASDGSFHDADYDGRSEYSLDQVIEALQQERVRVDVIGLPYLPIQQIALATGGTWRAILGKSYLEYVPPLTLTSKMLSEFGSHSFSGDSLSDELIVFVGRRSRPKWLKVSWKVLNPLGEKCYGLFEDRVPIPDDGSKEIRFNPSIDVSKFRTMSGTYTFIYRLENDLGHKSILRQAFDL
jgi:Mg-chelatase subunit ChlD